MWFACVLNLVPNKNKVIQEIYRVLKPGGHFSISDIVLEGNLPAVIQQAAEMYAGCVTGAIQKEAYLNLIQGNGFTDITIQKSKVVVIPDDILGSYLSPGEIKQFRNSGAAILSITVYAQKPEKQACCAPGAC